MSEIAAWLTSVLLLFTTAFVVRLLVSRYSQLSYASMLVAVGLGISVGAVPVALRLSNDLILVVFLPAILFEGTLGIHVRNLLDNLVPILLLTVVGLPVAIGLLTFVGTVAFSPLVAVVFAAIVLPTDPAAVLALFEEFDVGDDLAAMVEGESLLNDGIAIAIFSTVLAMYRAPPVGQLPAEEMVQLSNLARIASAVLVMGGGGLLVGLLVGWAGHLLAGRLDDQLSLVLLSVVLAYGTFLVAEEYLGVSGILAVVGAGLVMGFHEHIHGRIGEAEQFVQDSWEFTAFLASTLLYLLIGAHVDPVQFLRHWPFVLAAAVAVVVVRALTVYPLVAVANRVTTRTVTLSCQHLMVWGGLHTVVPVALALSLPVGIPHRQVIQTTVFGVAIFGTIVQGLLMPAVMRMSGVSLE